MTSASEWLTIIETLQLEVQELRELAADSQSPALTQQITTAQCGDDARSAFAPRPAKSCSGRSSSNESSSTTSSISPTSNASGQVEAMPLDLERYARVCDELEATRQRLTQRELKNRQLRARANEMKQEIGQNKQLLKESEAHRHALILQLSAEQSAKQEAVERAALAMIQHEEGALKLQEVLHTVDKLHVELSHREKVTRELQRRQSNNNLDESLRSEDTLTRLETGLQVAQKENALLKIQLEQERERWDQHTCVNEAELTTQERVAELKKVLTLQTDQLEKQQHAIVDLHAANATLKEQLSMEAVTTHRHYTSQLEAKIVFEEIVDQYDAALRSVKTRLVESEERGHMQLEEMSAYVAWRRSAMCREVQRDSAQQKDHEIKEKMERMIRHGEGSRRRALAELAGAKRQLYHIQSAMHKVHDELERLHKTCGVFRTREANVSRTLREYGRRNRQLQDAVKLMSSKVLQLSESLQRSEQRKQQVVVQSHELKRGLVIERCQREDLLQQCVELEQCLRAFQQAAGASAARAQSVEKENAVLQHAVTQLCAYSRELTESQQALQSELKVLEIHGRVEPEVFG